MMEYTLARMAMVMCGVLLIAAVVPPVTSLFEEGESSGMQGQSEMLCRMIDSFHDSEAEEMTICLGTVLPQNSSVTMDGYFITIADGENKYRYNTEYPMQSDCDVYTGNDYIRMTKQGSTITIGSL